MSYFNPVFFVLAFLGAATSVSADFRCPTTSKIISEGMLQYEVEARCGEPTSKTTNLGPISVVETDTLRKNAESQFGQSVKVITPTQIDQWVYDFGPSKFMRVLRFENGVLRSIQSGKYGSKPQQ